MKADIDRIKIEFGEKLKVLRESAGLSQEELGSHIGKEQQYIQSLEKGKRDIRLSTLFALAAGLKKSPKVFCELKCMDGLYENTENYG